MPLSIPSADLQTLLHEADVAARRVQQRLRLPGSDRADLRQEFLLDLIARLPAFDPERGSLGAFAGTVAAHKSVDIARKLRRERRLFGANPISIDDPERSDLRETVADDGGLAHLFGMAGDRAGRADLAVDVTQAVATLPTALRSLCTLLQSETPTAARRKSGLSRATFYRRLREVRLRFLIEGVRAAA